MPGLTNAEAQATLDARFPVTGASDFIQYSVNGTTEFAGLVGTAIGATGWAAATNADPSVKANANALTSAAATASGAVSHFRIATAATGGTGRTDWTTFTSARTVAIGDQLTHAAGVIQVTLT
jgi:hypothetical protein